MVVDLGEDEGSQLALGEGLIFVESLTGRGSCCQLVDHNVRRFDAHLTQGASDFCPHGVDIIVEGLEGKDLELGLLVGEEAQDSGCRDEAGHREDCGERERDAQWWMY